MWWDVGWGLVSLRTLVFELLIQWQHRPTEETTWESYDLLKTQFPTFRLEDKSAFGERSIVKPIRVYQRRINKTQVQGVQAQAQLDLLDQLKTATGLILDQFSVVSG
ncbi:hypothetical protein E3N88_18006 [Mikania micrantha]|uniref:Chromo domain-containing protein n=1 Tax=Mikania micrantha TaxID=192012 RepID=A0A5N6NUV8_9ASTR|nr:hypothetical protein E3N88_18006 [Mikania micrantha]